MKPKTKGEGFSDTDWKGLKLKKESVSGLRFSALYSSFGHNIPAQLEMLEKKKDMLSDPSALKASALQQFEKRKKRLEMKSTEASDDFKKRTMRVKKKISSVHNIIRLSASPRVLTVRPDAFLLSAKVLSEEEGFGLPGLDVRFCDLRKKTRELARGRTDDDGNAVLYLAKEQAVELGQEKVGLTVEILTLKGKLLYREENTVVPRLNHVETWVKSLPESKELKPHIEEAVRLRNERESSLSDLNEKINRLKVAHDAMQDKIALKLNRTEDIISGRKGEPAPKPGRPSRPSTPRPPEPGPSGPEPKPSPKKAKQKKPTKKQAKTIKKVAKPKIARKKAAKKTSKKKVSRKKPIKKK
jgi:hypothetical protein